ncbi:centromere protein Q isoform X1 [Lepisosteus oculatus]|uniref:Centromere protein Q n=1 Tax=Lepisosteus oculatus TaxID=7918 RepID=W5MYK2_LEPOC|nr:PREDICTED: centromere protein Q isoform X1 [Lepisosteus oculatus]
MVNKVWGTAEGEHVFHRHIRIALTRTKPPRASGRPAGPTPSRQVSSQVAVSKGKTQRSEPQKKKVCSVVLPAGKKGKVLKDWKPLPKSSLQYLSETLNMAILSVLSSSRKDREELQRQLNKQKDSFLAHCAQLKVPSTNQGDMRRIKQLHQVEKEKLDIGKNTLHKLEDNVSCVVKTLEEMEVEKNSLQERISTLRVQQEKLERCTQKVLPRPGPEALQLPRLPPRSFTAPLLQEQMMKMLPNPGIALQLGQALQASKEMKDIMAFLELAHDQVDRLEHYSRSGPETASEGQRSSSPEAAQ